MMSEKLNALLLRMERSGNSQQVGVADHLRTVASNGGEQEADAFIAVCADLLAEAAKEARDHLSGLRTTENRLVCDKEQWYSDWQDEVAVGATRLGFVDWLWYNLGEIGALEEEEGDAGDSQS